MHTGNTNGNHSSAHQMPAGRFCEANVRQQYFAWPCLNAPSSEGADLIKAGVKFYFCQNTTRGMQKAGSLPADATGVLIPGVQQYVTAGIAAIADFQARGYKYVQP